MNQQQTEQRVEPDGLIPKTSILDSEQITQEDVKILQKACPLWMEHLLKSKSWIEMRHNTPLVNNQLRPLDIGQIQYCVVGEVFNFTYKYYDSNDVEFENTKYISRELDATSDRLCQMEKGFIKSKTDEEHKRRVEDETKKFMVCLVDLATYIKLHGLAEE